MPPQIKELIWAFTNLRSADVFIKRIMNKLKILREINNYTQQYIGEGILKISQASYGRLEQNPLKITADQAMKLGELYKVDFTDLLAWLATNCGKDVRNNFIVLYMTAKTGLVFCRVLLLYHLYLLNKSNRL